MKESIVHALFDDDGAETVALIDTNGFLVYAKGVDVEKTLSPLVQFSEEVNPGGIITLISENKHLIATKLQSGKMLALSFSNSEKTGFMRMKITDAATYLTRLNA